MPSSVLNSDDGVISGTSGLKSSGGDDGVLNIQNNGTTAVSVASDGDVGIGTTSPAYKLDVNGSIRGDTFVRSTSGSVGSYLVANSGGGFGVVGTATNHPLLLNTNDIERMRITSGGQVLVGQTSSPTAKFAVTANVGPDPSYIFTNASTSSVSYDMFFQKSAAAPNSTGARFLTCVDTSADRLIIQSNGSVINATGSYGTISDQKLKQDIVDAGSQWDDIKNLRFRKYRLKTDVEANPNAKPFLGLVAQEVELVSPGLVDESPDVSIETGDLGTTTKQIKTSVLYMKAIKALQEAMERIETLEAKVAALEAVPGNE